MAADAGVVDAAAGEADVDLREIEEARGRARVVDGERVALARAIAARDHERAVGARQRLGQLDDRRARKQRRLDLSALHPERGRRALARLLGGKPDLSAVARDLGAHDLGALHLARLQTDRHAAATGATRDGLVRAGLQIAQHQHVARRKADHLAYANIVHELDLASGALHVLHQRGGQEGGGEAGKGRGCGG